MAYKWNNTTEEVNYLLTGTENPLHLTEREKVMRDKFVKLLEQERDNPEPMTLLVHRSTLSRYDVTCIWNKTFTTEADALKEIGLGENGGLFYTQSEFQLAVNDDEIELDRYWMVNVNITY